MIEKGMKHMSVCHKHSVIGVLDSVIGVLDSGVGGLTVASELSDNCLKRAFIILVIMNVVRMGQEV